MANEYYGPVAQGKDSKEGTHLGGAQRTSKNMRGVMSDSQGRSPLVHSPMASKSRKKSGLGKRKKG